MRLKDADGPRFRRQHPVGPYVLDFYCPAAKLAVEVDGDSHNFANRGVLDQRRDAWLHGQGITVLRIRAADVLADPDEAAGVVWRTAMSMVGRS